MRSEMPLIGWRVGVGGYFVTQYTVVFDQLM